MAILGGEAVVIGNTRAPIHTHVGTDGILLEHLGCSRQGTDGGVERRAFHSENILVLT